MKNEKKMKKTKKATKKSHSLLEKEKTKTMTFFFSFLESTTYRKEFGNTLEKTKTFDNKIDVILGRKQL